MKHLKLTRGYTAIVDDVDYARCSQYRWHAMPVLRKDGSVARVYAARKGGGKNIRLHRFVLGVTDPHIWIDHKDRDGLNCQHSNLREASPTLNQANTRTRSDNTSGYRGVCKIGPRFRSRVRVKGVYVFSKVFDTAIAAALAYDEAARRSFGEFATTNFTESL